MTPLATRADVETRLGRTLTTAEATKTDPGLLEEASVKVLAYLGLSEDHYDALTVPTAVIIVTSRMVARVLEQASAGIVPGVQQQGATTGPFSSQTTFVSGSTSGGPWLAAGDKQMLKPYRSGGGMASVQVTTGRTGAYLREV